jgi:hypothetical protein
MLQAVEADYHDGIVELKRKPVGIRKSKALVVFLDDADDAEERGPIDLEKVRKTKSVFDKWIGVIEGAKLGDWKAERRAKIEGNPHESSL